MKKIIVLTATILISSTPLAAQDIPLSKILVEKEGWRQVARPGVSVTFLEGLPSGDIAVNCNGDPRTLTSKGKFFGGPLIYHLIPARTAMATSRHIYAIDADGKSVACFKEGKRTDLLN